MRTILLLAAALPLAAVAQPAAAQDQSYYRCENKAVRLHIAATTLGEALKKFTAATRCPVSIDVKEVANTDPMLVPTAKVKGRYTPARALARMLSASPLKYRTIKGGYSIYMN